MIDYILLEKYTNNISVLFVEDDKNIRKELKELLDDIFIEVDIEEDGDKAYSKYMEYHINNNKYYDLVISDIKMPNVNGIELVKNIYKKNKKQKIIILSAYDESKYLVPLLNIGISQFIKKPVIINSFLEIIFDISEEIYNEKKFVNIQNPNLINLSSNIVWNKENKNICKNGKKIKLTKKEILFLDLLLKDINIIHSQESLLGYLWKEEDFIPDILNLNNVISRLRKKIPTIQIENIYALGYKIKND